MNNVPGGASASIWITSPDQSMLLEKQSDKPVFGATSNGYGFIEVDSTQTFQAVDGFGYTLTGGSAGLINKMGTAEKANLLQELFGSGDNSIGISYLRISIGSSDLDESVFSYDDLPAGQTDSLLANFSLTRDTVDLIPLLKQILSINPQIKILGSPWSPPAWMKDNGNTVGGSLMPKYYAVYSQYLVKYIRQMEASGIRIDAITPQNEPLNGENNPSMLMSAAQQADFIGHYLGPAFQAAGIRTKIILYDHNCDHPDYPMAILNDATTRPFVDGSAFHLYAGDISALSTVHSAFPEKQVYFTEQWTGANGTFAGDLGWHLKNVIIGSMRNWSRVALEWNLANGPDYKPHTPGGCSECKGALTLSGSQVTRNVGYYIIAHASKFVPPGSVRIASNSLPSVSNAAFRTPAGQKVLIALNDGNMPITFNLRYGLKWITVSLPSSAAGTIVW